MCRLFGMLSTGSYNPKSYLYQDDYSLLTQADADESRSQADGWGVAYLDGTIKVVKSPGAVFNESEHFKEVVDGTNSSMVLGHIRDASNPYNIPKERLLSMESAQPFRYQELVFIHNGVINNPDKVNLGKYRDLIESENDSEVLFWLLIKCLEEEPQVIKALDLMERILMKSVEEGNLPYSALNMIFSDGFKFYAYCRYFPHPGRSLCTNDQKFFTMSYLPSEERIIVMSEPSNTEEEWLQLENKQLLVAEVVDDRIEYSMETLD